ncbi:MAG: AAA family ATPase [Terriglobia bacterium]
MLKTIRLKNFKLHVDTSIEAAPITVFIGPNNSGKSSIFQALLALRQASASGGSDFLQPVLRRKTEDQEPYSFYENVVVDLGGFKDVVRHGQRQCQIAASGIVGARNPVKYADPAEVSFDLQVYDNKLVYHRGHFHHPKASFNWQWAPGLTPPLMQPPVRVGSGTLMVSAAPNFRLIAAAIHLQKSDPTTPDDLAALNELGDLVGNAPSLLLNSLHPIFPLRGFEESGYPLAKQTAENIERLTLADRSISLASMFVYDRNREDTLSLRMEDLFNVGIEVKLLPGPRAIVLAKDPKNDDTGRLFTNEGTGANQMPFILLPVVLAPPNETILLSEPEAHLHPKKQSEVISVLLRVAKQRNLQFFMETHSEHVLHKLLHAVARGDLEKEELAIYYFKSPENGTAEVQRLAVDDKGGVEGGLPGFYDQSLDELSEYLDALKGSKS